MTDTFSRWRDGLAKTSKSAFGRVASLLGATEITAETWDDLEALLIQADLGIAIATDIIETLRGYTRDLGLLRSDELKDALQAELRSRLDEVGEVTLAESPPSVILLVGVNGSGKTTILNILSRHFGWNLHWTSTRSKKKSKSKFWSDVWDFYDASFKPKTNTIKIGDVYYKNNEKCELHVPLNVNEQYQINYQNQQNVPGIYIPSHAQPFSYQKVQNIPTDPKTSSQHFQEYQNAFSLLL